MECSRRLGGCAEPSEDVPRLGDHHDSGSVLHESIRSDVPSLALCARGGAFLMERAPGQGFIAVEAVTKIYPSKAGPVHALGPISLTIDRAEFVAVVGP